MKATVYVEPGKVEIQNVKKPTIKKPTDAVIRVLRACVCGSDLWFYRGIQQFYAPGTVVGHEAIGIVDSVGSEVTNFKPGDFVIVPFTHGCSHCVACKNGFDGDCLNDSFADSSTTGYQAEYLRTQNANWAMIKVPGQPRDYSDEQLNDLLTLADVMATGYHAAASAEVKKGDTVAVIGDGAVGLCGVIGAKLRGATKIILLSHHKDRAKLGREFGATDIVSSKGEQAVKDVLALTEENAGADGVLECVGATSAIEQAGKIAHPGAVIGRVGVPQTEPSSNAMFNKNGGLRGGIASVTTYDKDILLKSVLDDKIHPGKVFTKRFTLDEVNKAYQAMDRREAIKSLLIVADK